MIQRRSLLLGLGSSLIAAPAIVRFSSLMPVKTMTSWWPMPQELMQIPGTENVLGAWWLAKDGTWYFASANRLYRMGHDDLVPQFIC